MDTPSWFCFLLCTQALCFYAAARIPCPEEYCSCKYPETICNGRGILTTLPPLPEKTDKIMVKNFNFAHLTSRSLRTLSGQYLYKLELMSCSIQKIEVTSLSSFTELRSLSFYDDVIPVQELQKAFQGLKAKKVLYVRLNNLRLGNLPDTFFQYPAFHRLKILHIFNNPMTVWRDEVISHLTSLRRLSVINCSVTTWISARQNSLIYVTFEGSRLVTLPSFCGGNDQSLLPHLRELNLDGNNIDSISVGGLRCLDRVLKLYLQSNGLQTLKNNTFVHMKELTSLDLSNNPKLTLEPLALNNSNLQKLLLKRGHVFNSRFIPSLDLFQYCPNLRNLQLQGTKLELSSQELKTLLSPLENLESLYLGYTHLRALPGDTFQQMKKLRTLSLPSNPLDSWSVDVFRNISHIRDLDIADNNIRTITEEQLPVELRRGLKRMDASHNLFACNCSLRWFTKWLEEVHKNGSIQLVRYPFRYVCLSPGPMKHVRLDQYRPTALECLSPYIIIAMALPAIFLVMLSASCAVYRYRVNIKLWWYMLRKRREYQPLPQGDDFHFHAFVAYNKDDHRWVVEELLPLEEDGLHLCIHERDFLAGRLVVENIVENMEASRKIILAVSNSFAASQWCQFELQEALEYFLRKRKDVLLVLLEPIQARHVSRPLRVLMDRTTYIEWRDCQAARRLFRERLMAPFRVEAEGDA